MILTATGEYESQDEEEEAEAQDDLDQLEEVVLRITSYNVCYTKLSSATRTVKAWPIDPLDLRNLKLEVSEKLPQG